MIGRRQARVSNLLDRLEALKRIATEMRVWRVVREGRDPCQCGAPGGRWDDGTFDVLYTSETRDGAISEIWFHLAKGQPIFPTNIVYRIHELSVRLRSCLVLPNLAAIANLGVDTSNYGQMTYLEKHVEYPRLQEVAVCAFFLGADAISVPSARWRCNNLIVFCDQLSPADLSIVADHGPVSWDDWTRKNRP